MTVEQPETEDTPVKSAASKLFDIRTLIGGLFVLYGLMLIVAGFVADPEEIAKADGININLWLGFCMLVLGIFFLVWKKMNPADGGKKDD